MNPNRNHAVWHGLTLDPFQQQALAAIDKGHSVLVSAPTGTGKTLIADYLVDQVLAEGARIIYTAPVKALGNQKYREYCRQFGEENVGIITGDVVINHDAPLRVMTTEILRNILLQGVGPAGEAEELGDVRAVILDELHFLDDPERGTVWEEVLIYLPPDVRILGLSATLSNLEELAGWLAAIRPGDITVVREDKRAVPLTFRLGNREVGILNVEDFRARKRGWDKQRKRERPAAKSRGRRDRRPRQREDEDTRETHHLDLIDRLAPEDLPALYFVFSRRATERCAGSLARRRRRFLDADEQDAVDRELRQFRKDNPNVLQPHHVAMYGRGIAFHHAGLNVALKNLVETLYEQRLIKILYCTSTFALGINMPARTVLFDALEKYNGKEVAPLTVRQFMQKAGRAGRRGLDTEGQVVIKMDFSQYSNLHDLLDRLLAAEHEPVQSAFNLSFHSVVNLLERFDEEAIRNILDRSFFAFQQTSRQQGLRDAIDLEKTRLDMATTDAVRPAEVLEQQKEKYERNLAKLERRMFKQQERLWEGFQEKVRFLQQIGYLTPSGEFAAGARIVRSVQIEEMFVTELVLAGLLEDLAPAELFGLCTGLVNSLPRQVHVSANLPDAIEERLSDVVAIFEGPIVSTAQKMAGGEPCCDIAMMALGTLWANGESLEDLADRLRSATDVTGDLVGAFRRAKDLVGHLRLVYWEDEDRRRELAAIIKAVTRDEVEAL